MLVLLLPMVAGSSAKLDPRLCSDGKLILIPLTTRLVSTSDSNSSVSPDSPGEGYDWVGSVELGLVGLLRPTKGPPLLSPGDSSATRSNSTMIQSQSGQSNTSDKA